MLLANRGNYDFVITEIGGTVGDIESLTYIEAVRQMRWELGKNCVVVHLTLVPYLAAAGELKTKPTQHSVKTLLESGVQPDIIVCRTEKHLSDNLKKKIALFCNVAPTSVIECIDAESIYDVPLLMHAENLDVEILKKVKVKCSQEPDLADWEKFLFKLKNPNKEVSIGLVGKYVELKDAYKSINESFIHAGAANQCRVHVRTIHSETITDINVAEKLNGLDGILVAPGFGHRGIEGKISAIRYIRENGIPFLGVCLGMQCAVVEFGRHVLGMEGANSTEFDKTTPFPVIDMMEMQKKISGLGGTMRLGAYPCKLKKGSKIMDIYKTENITERHRHRYEFNNAYLEQYHKAGLIPSGINEKDNLVEIVELKGHPWFIGVQFHPEFKSTVANPHPLFRAFVKAAIDYSLRQKKSKIKKS
jgi:CTP synthase